VTDSGEFSGMTSEAASAATVALCEARGIGRRSVSYHLRDWLISRQRYWGAPIPIVYCSEHGAVPVPEEQLPVLLPDVEDYAPRGTGLSPLASVESFVQTTCPVCGAPARRETDVCDNFVDSAWYYLRYPSTGDDLHPWDPVRTRRWLPVDMYVGGAEHSVLHLMYARFIAMALHDLGLLDFEEPFRRFRANGMITKNGAKISKSRGQTVNPDAYIDRYGADVFRTYMLFMGPYEAGGDFSDTGIGGVVRFLHRVYTLVSSWTEAAREAGLPAPRARVLHGTIMHVTRDIEALKYNTAIAALMKYMNMLAAAPDIARAELDALSRMLAPFAPFLAEELWERLGGTGSIHTQPWPEADKAALADEVETIVIQVDGRVRDRIELPTGLQEAEVASRAAETARVRSFLQGRSVRTVVHVPGRLINFVTGAAE
jgi:leucyl-tRNA synthetase